MRGIFADMEKNMHPNDIAEKLVELDQKDRLFNFYCLPKELKVEVFSYLNSVLQREIIEALGTEETKEILNMMAPDDRTEFFLDLPDELIKETINLLGKKQRDVALKLLGYPENSVARIMTPFYIRVKEGWTVERVFDHIKRYGKIVETLNIVYVVDDNSVLLDDIPIGKFLMAEPGTLVSELCDYSFKALPTTMLQELGAQEFKKYDRSALPVITDTGVLVGIVTSDDIIDVITEEMTEDAQKYGAVEALETPYVNISLFNLYKKRAGWLIILFIGETITANAMGYFQHQLERAIVLALFIPLIISSGGNTGSQASTLIIRALALEEITLKDWLFVLRRETIMGLMLGLTLAIIGFLRIETWQHLGWFDYGEYFGLLGLTVAVALIGVALWGTIVGAMIPFILKSFRLDPATASAPFVATLVDVTGLVIYFLVAMVILSNSLL
ncbi:MAG: magnesium transporter [Neisseriaceae bacterium]|nr:MAG: magnesium transporter [Neisseriaceae bacterium]